MIINARIERTYLGLSNDYNFKDAPFILRLVLQTTKGMTALGDYILDSEVFNDSGFYAGRKFHVNVGKIIHSLLKITETNEWEEIQGAYIRCKLADGDKFKIISIGHIVDDVWIDLSEWLKEGDINDESISK